MPAERGDEGARRAVANAFGDFADCHVFPVEQVLCDSHAPGEKVFHRRHAHRASGALPWASVALTDAPASRIHTALVGDARAEINREAQIFDDVLADRFA